MKTMSKLMQRSLVAITASTLVLAAVPAQAQQTPQAQQASAPWALVDEALGRAGTTQPDGVRRYSFPRSDLNVRLDDVAIMPALALGSWVAFQSIGDEQVMVMGDLVLTHDEVNPVMSALLDAGLSVTALHNHLLRSSPATMYMHIGGHGQARDVAVAIASALAKSRTPLGAPSTAPASSTALDLDTAALDRIMESPGRASGGVYHFSFPRPESVTHDGMPAPATMGTGTALNFQPLGGGRAAITGDFVLRADEVGPVMRALRTANIEVTALHNHMLDDEPRLFFMHFWAQADANALARGLRSALDEMAEK